MLRMNMLNILVFLSRMNLGEPPVAESEHTFRGHPTVPRFKFTFHAKVGTF